MFYVEFLIDGEPYELDHPGMVFTKCVRCGKKIYGYCDIGAEIEPLCDECNPPPDPKKKLMTDTLAISPESLVESSSSQSSL